MSEDTGTRKKRFGFLALTIVLVLGFLAGGLATAGLAAHHFGRMGGIHGWGHHHDRRGGMNVERVQEHMQRMIGAMAWKLDATDEQKQKIKAIAEAAMKDLLPMHEKFQAAHKRARDLFLQPAIDRAALEALRAEQILLADEASRKVAQALADFAEVLTPEQRSKLAKRWHF